MESKLPDEVLYNPCGGCGATNPMQRCIGCFHPFEKTLTQEYTSLCKQYRQLKERCDKMEEALNNIISMNRQHALDQYGNADKAETWGCVVVARDAIAWTDGHNTESVTYIPGKGATLHEGIEKEGEA